MYSFSKFSKSVTIFYIFFLLQAFLVIISMVVGFFFLDNAACVGELPSVVLTESFSPLVVEGNHFTFFSPMEEVPEVVSSRGTAKRPLINYLHLFGSYGYVNGCFWSWPWHYCNATLDSPSNEELWSCILNESLKLNESLRSKLVPPVLEHSPLAADAIPPVPVCSGADPAVCSAADPAVCSAADPAVCSAADPAAGAAVYSWNSHPAVDPAVAREVFRIWDYAWHGVRIELEPRMAEGLFPNGEGKGASPAHAYIKRALVLEPRLRDDLLNLWIEPRAREFRIEFSRMEIYQSALKEIMDNFRSSQISVYGASCVQPGNMEFINVSRDLLVMTIEHIEKQEEHLVNEMGGPGIFLDKVWLRRLESLGNCREILGEALVELDALKASIEAVEGLSAIPAGVNPPEGPLVMGFVAPGTGPVDLGEDVEIIKYRDLGDYFAVHPQGPRGTKVFIEMYNKTLLPVDPTIWRALELMETSDGQLDVRDPGAIRRMRLMLEEEKKEGGFVVDARKTFEERTWGDWYEEHYSFFGFLALALGCYLGYRWYGPETTKPWDSSDLH